MAKPRLDFDFSLQYDDPDFEGQLSVLLDIDELPEKATLKILRSESEASSTASSDTEILPHVPIIERRKTWPDQFPVPDFAVDVQCVLRTGNADFESTGKILKLTKAQKHNILEEMATVMHGYKPYPNDREVALAAEALVKTHPCLKEPGTRCGWYGWKTSLKFKMGNYRTKLARSGVLEVSVNAGKKSKNNPNKEHSHTNIKKARRAEVNFLPNLPNGETQASLEEFRLQIIDELQKTDRGMQLIENLMQKTFALRRQEIVQGTPLARDFLERWPAIKMQSQLCAEFHRITNVNIRNQFYAELDRQLPGLMAVYREKAAKTGKGAEDLRLLLQNYDLQTAPDVSRKRAVALRALPVFLREEDPVFFKTWTADEFKKIDEDPNNIKDTPLAIATVAESPESPGSVALVVEDELFMTDIPCFADALVLMFGLMYVLHLNYPDKLILSFTFVQKILMGLDDGKPLKPRLNNLNNDLLLKQ